MLTYVIIAILVILILALLVLVLVVWFLRPSSTRLSAKMDLKTQPIVQRFISDDLKRRAFIVRLNEGGYKVIYQRYSNEIISLGGEVVGWQTLPEKPVTDSLSSAVEIAQSWVHANEI